MLSFIKNILYARFFFVISYNLYALGYKRSNVVVCFQGQTAKNVVIMSTVDKFKEWHKC